MEHQQISAAAFVRARRPGMARPHSRVLRCDAGEHDFTRHQSLTLKNPVCAPAIRHRNPVVGPDHVGAAFHEICRQALQPKKISRKKTVKVLFGKRNEIITFLSQIQTCKKFSKFYKKIRFILRGEIKCMENASKMNGKYNE